MPWRDVCGRPPLGPPVKAATGAARGWEARGEEERGGYGGGEGWEGSACESLLRECRPKAVFRRRRRSSFVG